MIFPELRRSISAQAQRLVKNLRDDGKPLSLNLPMERKAGLWEAVDAQWYARNGYYHISEILLGGMPSIAGETVNIATALSHPVIYACVNLISGAVGFTPAMLYRKTDAGKYPAPNHPMFAGMSQAPNDENTAQEFTELLTAHVLLYGNAYAKIIRRSGTGTAIELQPLVPMQVKIDRETTGQKRLVYKILNEKGAVDGTYYVTPGKPHDILHIKGLSPDGIKGYSVVEVGRQVIGSALAAERHIATFWANGGRKPYWLERMTEFKDQPTADAWRQKWEERVSRPNTPPIVTDGTKVHEFGTTFRESQGIENRAFVTGQLCNLFDLNPTLVGDASRATFNNHEQYMLQFVRMTLQKHYTRWEQAFSLCVLTPEERAQGYFLRHDVRTLLRGDFQNQMQGFATALQNGYFNIDEVRDDLDMNPLPDGAGTHHHIQLNMQTLPGEDGQLPKPEPQKSLGLVRIA